MNVFQKMGDLHPGQICAGGEKNKDACQVSPELGPSNKITRYLLFLPRNLSLLCPKQGLIAILQGDSGGPLTYGTPDRRHVLVGITSHGQECGVEGMLGVYSRMSHYTQWILSKMESPVFCRD